MNPAGRGGYVKGPPRTLREAAGRFWLQVQKGEGCWLWMGKRNPRHDYGQFYVGWDGSRYVEIRAHRAAWELEHGPIPEGLYVCHQCDTPLCVRPEHLHLGTHIDNMRDMVERGRHASRPATHCNRGHEFTPENTTWWRDKKKCRACVNLRDRAKRLRSRMAI